jgi:membrane-associated protein
VRTFAPFVAGMGRMTYRRFAIYNVTGAILWVGVCVPAGYFFGNIPAVKENFTLVLLAIIFVSLLPGLVSIWNARRDSSRPSGSVA